MTFSVGFIRAGLGGRDVGALWDVVYDRAGEN